MDVVLQPPPDGAFAKILVPTLDTCRSTWIINTLAQVCISHHYQIFSFIYLQ